MADAYPFEIHPQRCPCGYDTNPRDECHCTLAQLRTHLKRVSGPSAGWQAQVAET